MELEGVGSLELSSLLEGGRGHSQAYPLPPSQETRCALRGEVRGLEGCRESSYLLVSAASLHLSVFPTSTLFLCSV